MGAVEDSWQARDGTMRLYLIQDAHTNESCQSNISKILELLLKKQSSPYLFLEAGTGDDSLTYLRGKGLLEARRAVGHRWLQRGELKGCEYLDLVSDFPVKLWGVEDKKLYFESIRLYEDIVKGRESFGEYLKGTDAAIKVLKPRIYNPLLLAYDAKNQAYHAGKITVTDYVNYLVRQARMYRIPLEDFPAIRGLRQLEKNEAAIDFKAASGS